MFVALAIPSPALQNWHIRLPPVKPIDGVGLEKQDQGSLHDHRVTLMIAATESEPGESIESTELERGERRNDS